MPETHEINFDPPKGEALKQEGMERALNHADRYSPLWKDCAQEFLLWYAVNHLVFTSEEVQETAYAMGAVPKPPDGRSWGKVMIKGKSMKIIKFMDAVKAKRPTSHRGYVTQWESQVYVRRG